MECVAVDWSGARAGAAARIWVATARDGVLHRLVAPGSRAAVQELLLARRLDPTPVLVGLDFAFGFPAWYAASRNWRDIGAVWTAARDGGEAWLTACRPPFWGRPGTTRPHAPEEGLRRTEQGRSGWQRPKSVFQVGGAGSVGTGSIRGMPMLLSLRDAGWAVWPFDGAGSHTVAEIWPRHFTGPVVKSSEAQRRALLSSTYPALTAALHDAMASSEDAFDAGITALGLSRLVLDAALTRPRDPLAEIEGWILEPPPDAPVP